MISHFFIDKIIDNMNDMEQKKRFDMLDQKDQSDLSNDEILEYVDLKFKLFDESEALDDAYTAFLFFDFIKNSVNVDGILDSKDEIREILKCFYLSTFFSKFNGNYTKWEIRDELVNNFHSIGKVFLDDLSSLLELNEDHTPRILNVEDFPKIMYELIVENDNVRFIQLIDQIFVVKYAIQGAKEYFSYGYINEINLNDKRYELDLVALIHIYMRHTERFSIMQAELNRGPRSFFEAELGQEHQTINNLLLSINENGLTNERGGKYIFTYNDKHYEIILKGERVVTIYPSLNYDVMNVDA